MLRYLSGFHVAVAYHFLIRLICVGTFHILQLATLSSLSLNCFS
jgi:hypothetical protein